ncbi:type II toxin-antitoxin system Phd/YefM family antitoxin [Candidatus Poriferisodalis sp.]|uniref:type II toxin-antitoxin system Phd/YefM family antitoxin n=1 Tax=Candidatus Poriferisodalis sp. TaxID=3101277 RepID=UPI003B01DB97
MRTVGVREFRDHASQLIAAGETLTIERHGKPVGFYVPIKAKDRREGAAALDKLGELVGSILARTGISEDELVADMTAEDAASQRTHSTG